MIKAVIKEIGIVILLLIAIALILSIIFYEYIPNNKTIPMKIEAYTLPEDIQEELEDSISSEEQNIVKTLYIDSEELSVYESANEYDKGKANPFADYSTDTEDIYTVNDAGTINTVTSNSGQTDNTNNSGNNEVYVTTPGKNY